MIDELLRTLAIKAGVSPTWGDQSGKEHEVSTETLSSRLAALGLPADSDSALRNSLSVVESGVNVATAGVRFTTARVGQPVTLPIGAEGGSSIEISLESGARRVVTTLEGFQSAMTLPPFDEPGYHIVHLAEGDFTIATAPERCITFADLNGAPGWGLGAQIYSLRSAGDGGIGHFGGVADLGRSAARLGADVLSLSPVHALFAAEPQHFSPYSPSTRLFYNPLHANPRAILPEALVNKVLEQSGLTDQRNFLAALPLVDWISGGPLRFTLLRGMFKALRQPDSGADHARAEFERFFADASPLLKCHATFEALHQKQVEQNSAWSWQDWPLEFRHPDTPAVAAFAAEHQDEIAFHIFLQWLTGRSYGEAQRVCRESGMKVGLVADLAIGVNASGSQAWSRQNDVLHGLGIGAPPDHYSAEGQDWGLTTFSPRGLTNSGFAPFIETLRACLRYAGGIRIDHVMGMSRLWLVPKGARPLEGAYVAFPSESLFRLIALESWRHRAIVIGEDLGTLPIGFKDYLREQGIAGMRVLRFEHDDNRFTLPRYWEPAAAAMTTTHDAISTAGWWGGADLGSGPDSGREHEIRAWDRGLLWEAFRQAGVAEGERPEPQDAVLAVDAAVSYIGATACTLKLLAIEDALAVDVQPNVPGTTGEKPNWRHRLDGPAAQLLDDPVVRERLRRLGDPRDEAV